MKLKQGDSVEVLRRKHEPYGSWFPGKINFVDGNYYAIKYESLVDHEGHVVIEKVDKKNVRPQPPQTMMKRWKVGDVAEVFDNQCWRPGKIAKVLKKNLRVVRVFGSIRLKEFHESSLRVMQTWNNNQWSVIGKVSQIEEFAKSSTKKKSKHFGNNICRVPLKIMGEGPCLRAAQPQKQLRNGHSDVKVVEKLCKVSSEMDTDRVKATTDRLYTSSRTVLTEDGSHSSVASCSTNQSGDLPSYDSHRNIPVNSDAESSFHFSSVSKHMTPYLGQKLEVDIHELEFHAYRSTVQALYASGGPLSWEQESLLTNLRLSLHISDEEHLLHLKQLLATDVL